MKNKTYSESDSENEVVGYTIIPKLDLEVPRLEVPDSVQQIISKIEQAQLFRAKEVGIVHENFIGCNLFFL